PHLPDHSRTRSPHRSSQPERSAWSSLPSLPAVVMRCSMMTAGTSVCGGRSIFQLEAPHRERYERGRQGCQREAVFMECERDPRGHPEGQLPGDDRRTPAGYPLPAGDEGTAGASEAGSSRLSRILELGGERWL